MKCYLLVAFIVTIMARIISGQVQRSWSVWENIQIIHLSACMGQGTNTWPEVSYIFNFIQDMLFLCLIEWPLWDSDPIYDLWSFYVGFAILRSVLWMGYMYWVYIRKSPYLPLIVMYVTQVKMRGAPFHELKKKERMAWNAL